MKTGPTIPDGDLGFDAISYAREIVSDPSHHDADEFSACARETLVAMLAAWDRLRERHDTLFRTHAFLMATKIPPTVISIPAPPAGAAREAAERVRNVLDWYDRRIHPPLNATEREAVPAMKELLAALAALAPPAEATETEAPE